MQARDDGAATPLWVVTGENRRADASRSWSGAAPTFCACLPRRRRPDLAAVVQLLAASGITRLMVEAGPTLSAAFLAADLVDEAVLFRSPNAIGPDGIDALEGMPLDALTRSPRLELIDSGQAGEDAFEHFTRRGD